MICIILMALSTWLLYKLIDQLVTLDHQNQYSSIILKQRNVLAHVLNTMSVKESEGNVLKQLKQFKGDSIFQKGANEVVVNQVSFFFKGGHLVRVDVRGDTER